jgi:hypothetical protein
MGRRGQATPGALLVPALRVRVAVSSALVNADRVAVPIRTLPPLCPDNLTIYGRMLTQIVIPASKRIAKMLDSPRLSGNCRSQLAGHLTCQVSAIVVVALDDSHIAMATEFLHC